MAPIQCWDYLIDELRLSDKWGAQRQQEELDRFRRAFHERGARGWELISYQAIPLTGSINVASINGYAYMAIFKRPSMAAPEDRSASWHPDPFGRAVNRYWDGDRWTSHVSQGDGTTGTDW